MRILVADDDCTSLVLLSSLLEKQGHECILAEDGKQAWDLYQQQTDIHIIISDWLMPNIDGLQLCKFIRAENRERYTYFILLTVLSGKGCFLEGMEAGADDFLSKPIDTESLMARLRVAERIIGMQIEINQMEKMLPICSYCKMIRDESDEWAHIDQHMAKHGSHNFSHSICPACYQTQVLPSLPKENNG